MICGAKWIVGAPGATGAPGMDGATRVGSFTGTGWARSGATTSPGSSLTDGSCSAGVPSHTGRSVGIDHFGASADYKTLFEKFGITADAVVDAARATVKENA